MPTPHSGASLQSARNGLESPRPAQSRRALCVRRCCCLCLQPRAPLAELLSLRSLLELAVGALCLLYVVYSWSCLSPQLLSLSFWSALPSSLSSVPDQQAGVDAGQQALPGAAAVLMPVCPRTVYVEMHGNDVGLGSKVDQLLTIAIASLREFDARFAFLDDRAWSYYALQLLFMPAPAITPILHGWNDDGADQTRAMELQLAWPPVWSTRPLFLDRDLPCLQDEHRSPAQRAAGLQVNLSSVSASGFTPSAAELRVLSAASRLHACSTVERDLYPYALLSPACGLQVPVLRHHSCLCSAAHADEYRLRYDYYNPVRGADWVKLQNETHLACAGPYGFRSHWMAVVRDVKVALPLSLDLRRVLALSQPRQFAGPDAAAFASLQPAPRVFYLKQRLLRDQFVVRPELRQEARQLLQRWGLRLRSEVREALWTHIARNAPSADSPAVVRAVPGIAGIACHIRRRDKAREAAAVPVARYVQAIEELLAADADLRAGFLSLQRSSADASCAAAGNASHALSVQVIVLTDDGSAVQELRGLRPCWSFLHPFPFQSELARVSDVEMVKLPLESKRTMARRLLVELLLLSEVDYAVVTHSSNIGRITAVSRGWPDSEWERRVVSIDVPWHTATP